MKFTAIKKVVREIKFNFTAPSMKDAKEMIEKGWKIKRRKK